MSTMTIDQIKAKGISDSTIRRAIRAGGLTPLPESRAAGKYVFTAAQVESWLATRKDPLPRAPKAQVPQ